MLTHVNSSEDRVVETAQPGPRVGFRLPLETPVASLAVAVAALLLGFDMLAGPLRYYLAQAGLESLVYLPKGCCFIFILYELTRRQVDRLLLWVLLLLFFYAGVGLLHQVSPKMQFFSLFLVVPALFGVAAGRHLPGRERGVVRLLAAVFAVTALGVYLDFFCDFPWDGFSYKVEGAEVEGSREWSSFGLSRRAGFTRMSAAAAFYLVCCGLFLFSYLKSWRLKLTVALCAFPAVLLTTNKAGIVGFLLGLGSLAVARLPVWRRLYLYGLAVAVMAFPFSTLVRSYDMSLADPVSLLLLASFEDRLINTWPSFLAAVAKLGSPLTGIGFGGVGSAVKYFSGPGSDMLAFADNFALYLYGCFGVAAAALFLYLARVTDRLFASPRALSRALAPAMVALLAASLTTDVVESQVFALLLGLAVASARDAVETL
ncbi:MAG: hypothetical protein A2075_02725 [Geobacteraceae bacterium GWC2_58_44]|nr:MAG: hypothetical protein A2075_02725 [Geobacteraceae bacterium GWC2_58_44]HBG05169.1 hypothetical protein [Geobacter sp.]